MAKKKYTIEDMREWAAEKGGKCLSEEYTNALKPLLWECKDEHRWERNSNGIQQGTWCRKCVDNDKKHTMDDVAKLAQNKNGKCLSKEYINAAAPMKWQCLKCEGVRELSYNNLCRSDAKICLLCDGERNSTIKDMQKLAKEKEGYCLSIFYIDSLTPLLWKCKNNHEWNATPMAINMGRWCAKCVSQSRKLTIKEMKEIAISRGGQCLSDKYIDGKSYLLWECAEKHTWEAKANSVKHNETWCPQCKFNKDRFTIEMMQEMAKNRGGKCLSKKYNVIGEKLLWQCEYNHKWEAQADNVKNGGWCPQCSKSKSETICRYFFEQIFKEPFPSCKPEWLLSDKDYKLELDGYNQKLGISFEHNGVQHYRSTNQIPQEVVDRIIENDKRKIELTKQFGVKLIIIPELFNKTKIKDLKDFIKQECLKLDIILPDGFDDLVIDIDKAYSKSS